MGFSESRDTTLNWTELKQLKYFRLFFSLKINKSLVTVALKLTDLIAFAGEIYYDVQTVLIIAQSQ